MRHSGHTLLAIAFFCIAAAVLAMAQTVTTDGGTTNSIPKFTGTATIGNSVITDNDGNVGIGTSTPSYTLDVNSAAGATWIGIGSTASSADTGIFLNSKNGGLLKQAKIYADWDGNLHFSPGNLTLDYESGSNAATLNLTGRDNGTAHNASIYANWSGGLSLNPNATSPVVGVLLNPLAGATFQVGGNAAIGYSANQAAPSNGLIVNGNTGIGTASPAYKLDVSGTANAAQYCISGSQCITAWPIGGGTITGVLPGTGLSGGGYSGNITLSIDAFVPRTSVSNTFTAQQNFSYAPISVDHSGIFIDNEQSNQYGFQSIVLSGIAAEFWNKSWYDTSWASGSIIAGYGGGVSPHSKTQMFHVDTRGTTYTYNGYVAGGFDYAELVNVAAIPSAKYEPGDVLVIDKTTPSQFALAGEAYSRLVAGVYSTSPGVLGSPHPMEAALQQNEIPLALLGQVPCKVSAENGPINVGDLLVTSSTLGHAMRADDAVKPGTILGKALESLPSGTGKIKILVTLQ